MIDERELFALSDRGTGPATPHRPVGSVLVRGAQLRRRRHAVRAVGVSTVAAGLIGTGLFVQRSSDGTPDVQAAEDPTTTTSEAPSAPPPPLPAGCEAETMVAGQPLAPTDVPADMRVLPGFVPGDPPITYASGLRFPSTCPGAARFPADDVLELQADGGDGISESLIRLSGPLPVPESESMGINRTPTQLRGGPATLVQPNGSTDDVAFAWTDAEGWSWSIIGIRVDEATLRATAEALVLDSSPEGDEPVASLAPDAVPAGFEMAWQTRGTPVPVPEDQVYWDVSFGTTAAGEAGMRCELKVSRYASARPLDAGGAVGSQPATVNGSEAVWHPVGGQGMLGLGSLAWLVAPDAIATVGCVDQHDGGPESIGLETMVQVAESVVPVAADDPRLPA